jgi:hypothetical protein
MKHEDQTGFSDKQLGGTSEDHSGFSDKRLGGASPDETQEMLREAAPLAPPTAHQTAVPNPFQLPAVQTISRRRSRWRWIAAGGILIMLTCCAVGVYLMIQLPRWEKKAAEEEAQKRAKETQERAKEAQEEAQKRAKADIEKYGNEEYAKKLAAAYALKDILACSPHPAQDREEIRKGTGDAGMSHLDAKLDRDSGRWTVTGTWQFGGKRWDWTQIVYNTPADETWKPGEQKRP